MASFPYVCRSCLGTFRLVGVTEAPSDFDYICEDCKAPAEKVVAKHPARKQKA